MSTNTSETWTVNVRGDAASKIAAIGDELESSSKGIKQARESLEEMSKASKTSTEGFGLASAAVKKAEKAMTEFGFSVEEQAAALDVARQVSEDTGVAMAVVVRQLKALTIETQSAETTTAQLANVMAFQLKGGFGKAEDAAKLFGQSVEGSTKALASLGPRGIAAAKAIDRITNADLKAKATTALLSKEVKRQQNVFEKAGDRVALFEAKMTQAFGPKAVSVLKGGLLAIGAAAAGVGLAFIKLAKEGIAAYLEENGAAAEAVDRLKMAWSDLLKEIGGALVGYDKAANRIDLLTGVLDHLTIKVKSNAGEIGALGDALARLAGGVDTVFTTIDIGVHMVLMPFREIFNLLRSGVALTYLGFREFDTALVKWRHTLGDATDNELADAVEGLKDAEGWWWKSTGAMYAHTAETIHNGKTLIDWTFQTDLAAEASDNLGDSLEFQLDMLKKNRQARELELRANRQITDAGEDTPTTAPHTARRPSRAKRIKKENKLVEGSVFLQNSLTKAFKETSKASAEKTKRMAEYSQALLEFQDSAAKLGIALSGVPEKFGDAAEVIAFADLDALEAQNIQESENAWTSWGDTLKGQVGPALMTVSASLADVFVQMGRGKGTMKEFGKDLMTMVGDLVSTLAPVFMQLGFALIATETGNALGLVAAGLALTGIAATLSSFGSDKAKKKAKSGAGDTSKIRDIAREFRRPEDREASDERTIVVQIGTREISREIRDLNRRGLT